MSKAHEQILAPGNLTRGLNSQFEMSKGLAWQASRPNTLAISTARNYADARNGVVPHIRHFTVMRG